MKRIRISALVLAALATLVSGCGSSGDLGLNKGGQISGQVTIDGKPVTAGTVIIFSANDQHSSSGPINEYGKYTVKEPPLGNCTISVRTSNMRGSVRGKAGPQGTAGSGSAGMVLPPPEERGLTYVPTPERYEDQKTSGLTVEIKSGNQEHDIPLTK